MLSIAVYLGLAIILLFVGAAPASAQVAMNVTLASNDVYRGRSLSMDDPALSLALGMDDPSGVYAGASVAIAAGDKDVRISSSSQYVGYARRSGRVSMEIGAIHRNHSDSLDPEYRKDFFEAYIGLAHKTSSVRLYVSPDYIPGNRLTTYLSVDTELARVKDWSITGHTGLTLKPSRRDDGTGDYDTEFDWSLGVGRTIGEFNVGLGIADSTDSDPEPFDGPLLYATISRAF